MLFGWSSILLLYLHSSSFTETIFLSEVIFLLNEQMAIFQLKWFQESFHVKQKLPGEREAGETIKPGNYSNYILHSHKKRFSLIFYCYCFIVQAFFPSYFFLLKVLRGLCVFFMWGFFFVCGGFCSFGFGFFCCCLFG